MSGLAQTTKQVQRHRSWPERRELVGRLDAVGARVDQITTERSAADSAREVGTKDRVLAEIVAAGDVGMERDIAV